MQIALRFFNVLADSAGTRSASIELPEGTTILTALQEIAARQPPLFQSIVLPGGKPGSYLKIFHNGKLVDVNVLNIPLHDGDELMLFPAVAGG